MLGELGVLGAKPFWAGEENRAKDAKDAKVKGKKDDEIAGGWSGRLLWTRNFMIMGRIRGCPVSLWAFANQRVGF
jgi:hypothetical protein